MLDISDIQAMVARVFSEGGDLAKSLGGFSARPSQLEMAIGVAQAIEQSQAYVVEAGTGTGKTFAYLVPALISGRRVLLSTATKTLQDQLFNKDLPTVRDALGLPVRAALLKGRQNYVCHFHLERAQREARLPSPKEVEYLRTVSKFSQTSQSGDKAECAGVPEDSPVWAWVTSNKDNCLGGECPHAGECFVNKARKDALESDVVVVNHHLFLADLALKEEGVAELLPNADVVIFDEAHQLPEIATQLLGQSIDSSQCLEFLRDVLIEGRTSSVDAGDWDAVVRPLDTGIKEIRRLLGVEIENARLTTSQFFAIPGILKACNQFADGLEQLIESLTELTVRSEAWVKLHSRGSELCLRWQDWFASVDVATGSSTASAPINTESVRWVSISSQGFQLCDSPLDVSNAFASLYAQQSKAWVFTSATLSVKGQLQHFTLQLGLDDCMQAILPSPFDYEQQALLCVPEQLPFPNESGFSEKLCECLWPLFVASDGGAFVLCTSHRGVRATGQWLKKKVEDLDLGWAVLVQGEASRAELLERFRNTPKPVLVGAASFWEGVDIRGDGLRLVIIDKLPFAPPDDPVFQAKSELISSRGGSPFSELSIPDAAIALKQGAGRLIRDEKDWGVLVIGDRRLVEKGYGKMLWRSLPPFKRTRDLQVAVDFMNAFRVLK